MTLRPVFREHYTLLDSGNDIRTPTILEVGVSLTTLNAWGEPIDSADDFHAPPQATAFDVPPEA